MTSSLPASLLLTYHPLLLERSYGGGGEGLAIVIKGGLAILASGALLAVLVVIGHWGNKTYGESFQKALKYVVIVAVLFYVVLTICLATS